MIRTLLNIFPRIKDHSVLGDPGRYFLDPRDYIVDETAKHGAVWVMTTPGRKLTWVAGVAARDVLKRETDLGLERGDYFDVFKTQSAVDIFGAVGETHRRLRELLRLGYSRHVAAQFVPEMIATVEGHMKDLHRSSKVDLFDLAGLLSLQASMAIVTPIDLRPWTPHLRSTGLDVMNMMMCLRPLAMAHRPSYKRQKRSLWAALEESIARHREGEFDHRPKMSMMDALLQTVNSAGDRMNDLAVRGACEYALVGAEHYTGRIVGFMLYEILRDASLLDSILNEVDAAFADGAFDASRLRRMPYFRAAYFETLRLYPLLPGLPFIVSEEFEVEGHKMRAGDEIVLCPHANHFSQEFFRNPFMFDANRCLPPRKEHMQPGAFAPFSAGSRACAAAGMVEVVVLTIIASLLRTTELRLTRPSQRFSLKLAPIITPRDPVLVDVCGSRTPREGNISALSEIADFDIVIEESEGIELPDFEPISLEAGTVIIEQGAEADAFYLLLEGEVEVLEAVDGGEPRRVSVLRGGSSFGEIGLLKNCQRTATVRALTGVSIIRVSRDTFMGQVAEGDLTSDELATRLKRSYVVHGLSKALPSVSLASLESYSSDFKLDQVAEGTEIIVQGDRADTFYIIVKGEVDVWCQSSEGPKLLNTLGPGDTMGELGILQGKPRSATCQARTTTDVIRIGRKQFLELLNDSEDVMEEISILVCHRLMNSLRASHPDGGDPSADAFVHRTGPDLPS